MSDIAAVIWPANQMQHGNPPVENSLASNPLFLALLKRIEHLEQRVNDLQTNPQANLHVGTPVFG